MRVPPRDLGFQVLETVSLAVPAEQSCTCDMVEETHHLSKSPTDPGKDQFLVSWDGSCQRQGFPISFSLRNSGMLPGSPAWGSRVHRGDRCWMTQGSCSLFPPSFAAKIHQFFPGFPRDTSSVSTKTTVLWACARLFAGMRRWLRNVTGMGTATDDLLFPSGKAEW